MPVSPSAALSRRHLLLAGAVGLSSLAALGSIAPARAEDVWTAESISRLRELNQFRVISTVATKHMAVTTMPAMTGRTGQVRSAGVFSAML